MPEFFEHLNPMPFEAAAQMEKDLAEDLRSKGYTVTGGTWMAPTSIRMTMMSKIVPSDIFFLSLAGVWFVLLI